MKTKHLLAFIGIFALLIASVGAFASEGRIWIDDDDEADHTGDAVITEEEAIDIAEAHMDGTAYSAELENEDGYLVWGIHVENADGKWDVKIDAGNGEVLKAESDDDDE